MKLAIYFDDNKGQLVLTPETAWERDTLKSFAMTGDKFRAVEGNFYLNRAGYWVSDQYESKSLVLVKETEKQEQT